MAVAGIGSGSVGTYASFLGAVLAFLPEQERPFVDLLPMSLAGIEGTQRDLYLSIGQSISGGMAVDWESADLLCQVDSAGRAIGFSGQARTLAELTPPAIDVPGYGPASLPYGELGVTWQQLATLYNQSRLLGLDDLGASVDRAEAVRTLVERTVAIIGNAPGIAGVAASFVGVAFEVGSKGPPLDSNVDQLPLTLLGLPQGQRALFRSVGEAIAQQVGDVQIDWRTADLYLLVDGRGHVVGYDNAAEPATVPEPVEILGFPSAAIPYRSNYPPATAIETDATTGSTGIRTDVIGTQETQASDPDKEGPLPETGQTRGDEALSNGDVDGGLGQPGSQSSQTPAQSPWEALPESVLPEEPPEATSLDAAHGGPATSLPSNAVTPATSLGEPTPSMPHHPTERSAAAAGGPSGPSSGTFNKDSQDFWQRLAGATTDCALAGTGLLGLLGQYERIIQETLDTDREENLVALQEFAARIANSTAPRTGAGERTRGRLTIGPEMAEMLNQAIRESAARGEGFASALERWENTLLGATHTNVPGAIETVDGDASDDLASPGPGTPDVLTTAAGTSAWELDPTQFLDDAEHLHLDSASFTAEVLGAQSDGVRAVDLPAWTASDTPPPPDGARSQPNLRGAPPSVSGDDGSAWGILSDQYGNPVEANGGAVYDGRSAMYGDQQAGDFGPREDMAAIDVRGGNPNFQSAWDIVEPVSPIDEIQPSAHGVDDFDDGAREGVEFDWQEVEDPPVVSPNSHFARSFVGPLSPPDETPPTGADIDSVNIHAYELALDDNLEVNPGADGYEDASSVGPQARSAWDVDAPIDSHNERDGGYYYDEHSGWDRHTTEDLPVPDDSAWSDAVMPDQDAFGHEVDLSADYEVDHDYTVEHDDDDNDPYPHPGDF